MLQRFCKCDAIHISGWESELFWYRNKHKKDEIKKQLGCLRETEAICPAHSRLSILSPSWLLTVCQRVEVRVGRVRQWFGMLVSVFGLIRQRGHCNGQNLGRITARAAVVGSSNTTNSSTVSASAQAEMGSTKVEAASNEQLLPFFIAGPPKRRIFCAVVCLFPCKCIPMCAQIRGRTCAYYVHSSFQSLAVSDA